MTSGPWRDSHLEALDHQLGPKHAGEDQVRVRVRENQVREPSLAAYICVLSNKFHTASNPMKVEHWTTNCNVAGEQRHERTNKACQADACHLPECRGPG